MKKVQQSALFLLFSSAVLYSQEFSKFIAEQPNSPFAGTSFIATHELRDSTGFLIIGDRYTNHRDGFIIKTDTSLNEVWTTILNFNMAPPPLENVNYFDIGELPDGRIYVHGVAADIGSAYHCIFLLDQSGNVIQEAVIQNIVGGTSVAYLNKIRIGRDSSILLPFSEYNKAGFLRLDQNLNVVNVIFTTGGTYVFGRDAIMLHDSTILFNSQNGLIKTDLNGNVIWARNYPGFTNIFSLYESPSGSIYVSGNNITTGSKGALMKIDTGGQPIFVNYYSVFPSAPISSIWEIYPAGNHIQCYSDSVMFRVDTNGIVQGWGKSINAMNYKIMKPGLDNRFILTGSIFQDSTSQYQYTVMKFSDTTQNSCLRPRSIVRTTGNTASSAGNVTLVNYFFPTVLSSMVWSPVSLDFDAVNGCPDGPTGLNPEPAANLPLLCYPNPTNETIIIERPESMKSDCRYTFVNNVGQVVSSGQLMNRVTSIDVTQFPDGVYELMLTDNSGNFAARKTVITH